MLKDEVEKVIIIKLKKKKSESTWLACKTRDMDNETKITS
jgi:hypothetical protein